MKAPFFKRLASYIIDILIVSILASIICMALPDKNEEIETQLEQLSSKLMDSEIDTTKYLEEYKNLLYENNKNTMIQTTVSLVLTIAYFIVFQYMNKGQTVGKKLLHIKVVDKDNKQDISIIKGLLRSIFILNILSSLISVGLIRIFDKQIYLNIYLTVSELEAIFVFISAIFILYRKDGRGLHDMLANTMVITEER